MAQPFRAGIFVDAAPNWEIVRGRFELAEDAGFDSVWLGDHLLPWWTDAAAREINPSLEVQTVSDETTPFLEGWTLLGALAIITSRVDIGLLVSNNLFRHPVIVAKMAVTLDQVSEGRLQLGLGAGWMEPEHHAYGFPFGLPKELVDRFEESVQVISSLLKGARTTYQGNYIQIDNAPFAPLPVQDRLPLVLAADGPRMIRIAARYADTWVVRGEPDQVQDRRELLLQECEQIGRDPAEIRQLCFRLPQALEPDQNPFASAERFRQIAESYRAVGADELVVGAPLLDSIREETIREVGEQVLPELRATS